MAKTRHTKQRVLIATGNAGKASEIAAILGDGFEYVTLADFPQIPQVEEDGETFSENACKKALACADATGLLTIADDSGLEVDVLDGRPGVRSARFAADDDAEITDRKEIDRRNIEKLLALLSGVPLAQRTARFVCCAVLARPGEILTEMRGEVEGIIAKEPAGTAGFGYDPVFYIPDLGKTAAQLTPQQKNKISHRGKAVRKLAAALQRLCHTK